MDLDEVFLNRLFRLGRRQGFITMDDILEIYPDAEGDADQTEDILAALTQVGITYIEEPAADELANEDTPETKLMPADADGYDDYLANVDIDDSIGLYIREASRVPLLTADEESDLAQRIENGRLAREELVRSKHSQRRQMELRRLVEDGWTAREQLITANSRLVISIAKKYMGLGVPFLDLIQEGNIGLMRAAKKFDYRRGFKFSTYATWWIRQAITRALADQSRTIRVPVHMGDQISRMMRVQHQLKQHLSRDPSVEEIAEALATTPKKVEAMIQASRRPLSLQTPVGDEEEEVLGDFIEDREAQSPDEATTYNLLREQVDAFLEHLPPREARILQLRYGLLDGKVLTLNEVGRRMGITRERVRQIEAQALKRLRTAGIQRELQAFIE